MLSTLVLIALIIGILKIVMPEMGETVQMILNITITLALIYLLFKLFMYILNIIPIF